MTQAGETAPATTDQIVDRLLRQIEAAWVTEQFDAIIEAGWPTGPPAPPPTAGPAHAEPPRPGSPAPVPPRGELHETRDHPRVRLSAPACPAEIQPPSQLHICRDESWAGRSPRSSLSTHPDAAPDTEELFATVVSLPERNGHDCHR